MNATVDVLPSVIRGGGGTGEVTVGYVGAHINRSSAGNGILDLQFDGAVTGSDLETGFTVECRAPNESYVTLDSSAYTSTIVDTNYIRYTLTGTVDTFQGSHELRVSKAAGGDTNVATFSNDTTLTNNSTLDLVEIQVEGWRKEELSGTRLAQINGNDLSDTNTVTRNTGRIGFAAQYTSSNTEYFTAASSATLQAGDIHFCAWAWCYPDSVGTNGVLGKFATGNDREWLLDIEASRYTFAISTDGLDSNIVKLAANSHGLPGTGAWDLAIIWHDPDANTLNIQINDGTVDSVSHSGGINVSTTTFYMGTVTGSGNNWDGRIDAPGIAKGGRVITSGERSDLYNSGNGKEWPYYPDHL